MSPLVPTAFPLHATTEFDLLLATTLLVAGLGSALLLGIGLAAFVRRRSTPYLLVVLALGTLAIRTGIAWLDLLGIMHWNSHHLYEHGLDVAMASLVVGAVWYARGVRTEVTR